MVLLDVVQGAPKELWLPVRSDFPEPPTQVAENALDPALHPVALVLVHVVEDVELAVRGLGREGSVADELVAGRVFFDTQPARGERERGFGIRKGSFEESGFLCDVGDRGN